MTDHTPTKHSPPNEILIFANPRAGRRSGINIAKELARHLATSGCRSHVITQREEITQAIEDRSPDAIVVAGGDGTLALALNQVRNSLPLTVLPTGTENLFARHFSLPRDPQLLARILLQDQRIRIDAGQANGRLFLLMLGCGLDADVVRQVEMKRTTSHGYSAFVRPIASSLRRYKFPQMRIHWQRQAVGKEPAGEGTVTGRWAFVGNFPEYGVGMQMNYQANPTDGRLDLCTLEGASVLQSLRYAIGVKLRIHTDWPDVSSLLATRLRIESDGDVPYQLDGDFGGYLPVEIQILPAYLEVVVPQQVAQPQ